MPARDSIGAVPSLTGGRAPRIFAHFFDIHFLEEKGVKRFEASATAEARRAFRLALLLADEVLVPASSGIESPLCRAVLSEYGEEFAAQITLVASGTNYDEFLEDKFRQYRPRDPQGRRYRSAPKAPRFPWHGRGRSATGDISAGWRQQLEADGFDSIVRRIADERPIDFEKRLIELPERLGKSAFIAGNVVPILFGSGKKLSLVGRNQFVSLINREYFGSYALDPEAAIVTNMGWLGSNDVRSAMPEHDIDYRRTVQALRAEGVLDLVDRTPAYALMSLRDHIGFCNAIGAVRGEAAQEVVARQYYLGQRVKSPIILILTALPEELAALNAVCDERKPLPAPTGDRNIYQQGLFRSADGIERRVAIASLSMMGKASAATAVTNALRSFNDVGMVVMCGIAGGCPNPDDPETHVRLGDIVVSTGIFEHDHVKQLEDSVEHRSHPQPAGHRPLQALRQLQADLAMSQRPWEGHLARGETRLAGGEWPFARPAPELDELYCEGQLVEHPPRARPEAPRVHAGIVATGDTLLKDPKRRDQLRDAYKVRAIEMEGSAVQSAGWAQGREAMVVRGVSDYCDTHKNDLWRYHAALAAAAFARSLVEAMPVEWWK